MEITVAEPVKINDREWDLVEHVKHEEFPESDGRHSDLCVVCGFPSYPECRSWCPQQGTKVKQ